MSKKIALFLVMVMFFNMAVWSSDGGMTDDEAIEVLAIIGIAVLVVLVIGGIILLVTNADTPDDGVRLTSLQDELTNPRVGSGSVLDFLQHVNVGFAPEKNRTFLGLNFRF
ncbi:MAG: hypothetical protein LBC80_02985 [Treponema sp.]|jgi:hypothetical protein|nr:hypothetical protein [Treponema sp.]